MNYHNITKDDMLNGDGLRVVLWVAGCTHHCQGCQNPVTWDVAGGLPFDEAAEKELFEALAKPYCSGITFSGGDPLHPFNRDEVFRLAKKIRKELPEKTIWLYTGFLWEEVKDKIGIIIEMNLIYHIFPTSHKGVRKSEACPDGFHSNDVVIVNLTYCVIKTAVS